MSATAKTLSKWAGALGCASVVVTWILAGTNRVAKAEQRIAVQEARIAQIEAAQDVAKKDHDLLIEINTKVGAVLEEQKRLRTQLERQTAIRQ